jgi:hypothetical protein
MTAMWGPPDSQQPRKPEDINSQCPRRSIALPHTQDVRQYADGRCIHCGVQLTSKPDKSETPTEEIGPPPLDVAARLGLTPIVPIVERTDSMPMETKMISGSGPSGPEDGQGRGVLTERQKRRLLAVKWRTDRMDP